MSVSIVWPLFPVRPGVLRGAFLGSLLGFLGITSVVLASPPAGAVKAGAAAAIRFDPGTSRATVPFENEGGLIFVTLGVGASRPLTFLLDTGFDDTILDAAVAKELHLAAKDQRKQAEPGGAIETATLPPVELRLPGLVIPDVRMLTLALGELSRVPGRRLDGILGHTVLSRFVLTVDYPGQKLVFEDPGRFAPASAGRALPMTEEDRQVFVHALVKVAGHAPVDGKFKIDTAGLDVMGFNNNFAQANHWDFPPEAVIRAPGVAAGGETKGYLFRGEWVELGGHRFERPFLAATVDSGGFENRPNAGTIGAALLSRFVVVFDYPHGRLFLRPGPGIKEPLLHDSVGVMLRSSEDFRSVEVFRILAGSPAAAAGLREGDRIVTVDGQKPARLGEIWERFRHPGTHKVEIERAGARQVLTVAARPLLP